MVRRVSTDLKLPYGKSEVSLSVPERRLIGVLKPREIAGTPDPYYTVLEALQNPVGGRGLKSAVKKDGTVVIVTDDYTRPTPSGQICEPILDQLNHMGVDDSHIVIVAAGGLHRAMSRTELRAKFGRKVMDRVKVVSHDAWNDSELEYVGKTSRGTPVWVNKLIPKADLRISVGMITAHFVSGYSAGPKTILPGASGYPTIFHNHGVIAVSPSARIGVTDGNPCWEDMVEAVGLLGPTVAVNVVLNTRNEIVAAFHGDPVTAQKSGLNLYHSIYSFSLKDKADIVVASANPMYSYLDQALKTVVHASMAVKHGGFRIIVSPCDELLGPSFLRELYYISLSPRHPSANEYARMMQSSAIKDIADAVGILKFLQTNNSGLTLVCDPSFDEDLTNIGFSHAPSVQQAFDETTARLGVDSKVLVVPYGAITFSVTE
jgi:nickel-dependent lactate racemase